VSLSRHELRQTALGLRMQSHVLQMAQVAAAIAEGKVHPPRLMNQINLATAAIQAETQAETFVSMPAKSANPTSNPTTIVARLDRIRAGMHDVVQHGTAAQAFSGPELKAIRPYLYGKTGTAPADETNNSAWFIGWVEAGQIPGQKHRLAFAAYVSHTDLTGGAHAAPMVAALLRSLLPSGLSSGFATAVR
jgi:cell division protein FtsI/penicillin-binding protein 2